MQNCIYNTSKTFEELKKQTPSMIENYIYEQTGLTLSPEMLQNFELYSEFLLIENEKYNLTAITATKDIWIKHFADSILGNYFLKSRANLCDVGSGAGFPSLPLKIVRNDISVTLVDSIEKKINFTKTLCEKLDLEANFYHSRAEDFAKTHSEKFDIAVARAVAPLNILLEYTAQIVQIGGLVLAYKTDLTEIKAAQNAIEILGLKFSESKDFVLPDGSKRCILAFSKVSHTPQQYPRGQNKARKFPL